MVILDFRKWPAVVCETRNGSGGRPSWLTRNAFAALLQRPQKQAKRISRHRSCSGMGFVLRTEEVRILSSLKQHIARFGPQHDCPCFKARSTRFKPKPQSNL